MTADPHWAAPGHLLIEVVSVIRGKTLRGSVTAYDAAYVAAAELLSCPLITCDARLTKITGVQCEIRLVSTG